MGRGNELSARSGKCRSILNGREFEASKLRTVLAMAAQRYERSWRSFAGRTALSDEYMNFSKLVTTLRAMFYSPLMPAVAAPEISFPTREPLPARPQHSPYFELGYKMAAASGALKPDSGYMKLLEEQVAAQAAMQPVARFDHSVNPGDQRKLKTLDALDEELEGREHECEMAAAELRQRVDEVAKLGGVRPRRAATPEFRTLAAIALTISVAPTLYIFFGGLFALLKWMLAIGFGGAISMMIVASILPDDIAGASQQNQGEKDND